jgi:hypothetical protein
LQHLLHKGPPGVQLIIAIRGRKENSLQVLTLR